VLDLVYAEEQVAHLTGLGFEELLDALDAVDVGNLRDRYAEVTDGYMVMAGRGNRSTEEDLLLDRIDSTLRMLLAERGLLVLAGRLLHIQRSATVGLVVFIRRRPDAQELLLTQQTLARAARLARDGLAGPVPVDGPKLADLAQQASNAAAELVQLRAGGGWLTGWTNRAQAAEEGLSRLLSELADRNADQATWQASANIFDPSALAAAELCKRLKLCRQLAGMAGCRSILEISSGWIDDLAGLVREGLGA
jgi:hypothetical protein